MWALKTMGSLFLKLTVPLQRKQVTVSTSILVLVVLVVLVEEVISERSLLLCGSGLNELAEMVFKKKISTVNPACRSSKDKILKNVKVEMFSFRRGLCVTLTFFYQQ